MKKRFKDVMELIRTLDPDDKLFALAVKQAIEEKKILKEEQWLYKNPKSLKSLRTGIKQFEEGKGKPLDPKYLHFEDTLEDRMTYISERLSYREKLIDKCCDIAEICRNSDKEVDRIGDEVLKLIYKGRFEFPIDFILESITRLGNAPCLIYDDNGKWAISEEGAQTCFGPLHINHVIEKKYFKKSIRQAVVEYVKDCYGCYFPKSKKKTGGLKKFVENQKKGKL